MAGSGSLQSILEVSLAKPGRLASDQRGASAVEFALLVPVYLLLVLGTMAYGIYFAAAHSIQQMAADLARAAVAGICPEERIALVQTHFAMHGGGYGLLDPERIHIEPDETDDPGQFRLHLSYDARDLPIWNLYPPLPLPQDTITHRTTIRNGGNDHAAFCSQ